MKLKQNIILIMTFLTIIVGYAQRVDSEKSESCIRDKAKNFFIEKDKLNQHEETGNAVHILEIVEKKVLGYNDVGIYFLSNAPSRKKYFLFKQGNNFKILTSNDSLLIMGEVVSFLKKINISNVKAVEYVNECVKIINENLNKPSEKELGKQDWQNCME